MEYQLSFADSEYQNKRRQTRKEKFLWRMGMLGRLFPTTLPIYGQVRHSLSC